MRELVSGFWLSSNGNDAQSTSSASAASTANKLELWVTLGFPVAQLVKNLPAVWKTWVQSLGWEDPLEKAVVPHSSTLAWKIPWMEDPGRLQSMESQRVRHD